MLAIANHRKICVHISTHSSNLVEVQGGDTDQSVFKQVFVLTTYHTLLVSLHLECNVTSHTTGGQTEFFSPDYIISHVLNPYQHFFQHFASRWYFLIRCPF